MKQKFLICICLICLTVSARAFSTRTLGQGGIYPVIAKDPTAIFYNPAYLAKNDSLRLSYDDNLAVSLGDLALGTNDSVYYLGHGFNTYSFLRLGLGVALANGVKDLNYGFDWDINDHFELAASVMNDEGRFVARNVSATLAYKSLDQDQSLAVNYATNKQIRLGFEQQVGPKAFYRFGYNVDHPTAGLTLPLHDYVDLDLAGDFKPNNTVAQAGVSLFRNSENKQRNSNHAINFGPAVIGQDKFIKIDGFNIHYVDAGTGNVFVLIGGGIHFTHHWDPYMAEFAKHYRVINIDHVGAGESDKPQYFFGYTIEEQGEIIHELLQKIGIKKAYLLGYCYGGSVAFYLAGKYPSNYQKLVVIEGFVKGTLKMRHDVEYLGAYLLRDLVTWDYRRLYPYFNGKMWYQLNKAVLYADFRQELLSLKAPMLYYAGTKSWAYDFLGPTKKFIKENVRDLTYIEIEGAGHDVDRYDQAAFVEQVLKFLAD